MIVDTSALIAILFVESDGGKFEKAIYDADTCRLSAGNFLELFIVIERQASAATAQQADMFLSRARITVEPVTVEQIQIARQAFRDFGKGKHVAGLNFGDCFSYALAKTTGEPLLFKGDDFSKTDIVSAL